VPVEQGRERTLHPRYAALASHYNFTPKFCLPATEKPRVDPVPSFDRPMTIMA
jgi:hypothetical protein